MASFMMRPLMRPQTLGLGLGLSLSALHMSRQRPVRLDTLLSSSSPRGGVTSSSSSYSTNRVPKIKNGGGLNAATVRQISSGSIIGLCAGVAVSTFSKSLTLLIGLFVIGVQVASSYGINVIPYSRLQKYVKGIDLRSAVQDNVAFKLSFGTTFALAAFAHF